MRLTAIHDAQVVRGALQLLAPERWKRWCQQFCEGDLVEITVRRKSKARSKRQNAYYWGVVIPLIETATYQDRESVHRALAAKFLSVHDDWFDVDVVRSTTSLTTVEFEEYLRRVREWASEEMGCYIPLPNEIEIPRFHEVAA